MAGRQIAEVFHPGEFIKDELEARGWSQLDLAEILGRDAILINQLIKGKRSITPETAKGLGDAFGTGAEYWMNLESAYQLHKVTGGGGSGGDDTIARRAKLYERFSIREMVKRGWIEPTDNVDVLEKRVLDFYELPTVDSELKFKHAALKGTSYQAENTAAQNAWMYRARQLARSMKVGTFSEKALADAFERLKGLLLSPEEVRHVPRILAEAGIRFLIVEALPGTRIDGVCFWLGPSSPVIALSVRFDRIDSFWFALMHELDHVKHKEGIEDPIVDLDLVGDKAVATKDKPEFERRADAAACESLVKHDLLEDFIFRVGPYYSKTKIIGFANRLRIHPGLVVGQLQHREEISYAHNREMLNKVRHMIIPVAITDGWGSYQPSTL
jgi:HTH-type transcriptional regulator / antitoxin HigA